jgi:hypothetical protein
MVNHAVDAYPGTPASATVGTPGNVVRIGFAGNVCA